MIDAGSIKIEYPHLYKAANSKSVQSQKTYLRIVSVLLTLTIISSLTSLFSNDYKVPAILSLVFLVITPFLTSAIAINKYDKLWYTGRSLTESIKTMSWRFMMRSHPYHKDDDKSRKEFILDLKQLFNNNKEFCKHLSDITPSADNLPAQLESIRKYNWEERAQIYLVLRIDDQKSWYGEKAKYNNRMSVSWFWGLLAIQLLAIACAALKIAYSDWVYIPTVVFAAMISAIVGWIQIKRYQDLTTSYALTAHEIDIVKMSFGDIKDEKQFTNFVGDAENAFSREHTQWFARKDT